MEAVVLFDYEKQQEDELDLTVGMTITNVVQADDGWCEGTYGSKRGMFPDNFVQLKPVSVPPPATAVTAKGKPPPPDPAPAPIDPPVITRAAGQKTKVRRAKVTFSYAAENPDELTLQPGQSVEILGEEEDGWWRGQVGTRTGLFPSNFVEVLPEETSPSREIPPPMPSEGSDGGPPALPPSERRMNAPPVGGVPIGGSMLPRFNPAEVKLKRTAPPPPKMEEPVKTPELKKKAPPQLPKTEVSIKPPAIPPQDTNIERAKVIFAYTSEQEDELTIQAGDILEVVDKTEQDGWWKVKLNGKVGLVPDNFVELLPSQQSPGPVREPSIPSRLPSDPTPKKEPKKAAPPPPIQEDGKPDFGVPPTDPLDSSAHKSRPHRPMGTVRPPSRSNVHQEEETATEAPWQKELKSRKKKEPVKLPVTKPLPPPAEVEKKPAPPPAAKIVDKHKPKPPAAAKPALDAVKSTPPPSSTPSSRPPQTPQNKPPLSSKPSDASFAPPTEAVQANEWKEALEKLREEFAEFKAQIRKEIKTLSNDLDEERKNNAMMKVDIDRLKKTHL